MKKNRLRASHHLNIRDPWFRVKAVCILWLISAITLIFLGLADGELLCDDGYYYFELARNAAHGEGFTFDSLHPTNGFHPLWAWILVPIFFLFKNSPWLPVHLALSLCALFSVGTALIIYQLFKRHELTLGGELASYVWLFNPYTVILSFRGLEGPLNTLLLALSIFFLDKIRQDKNYSYKEMKILGITVGLTLLSRTDNIFWLAVIIIFITRDLFALKNWKLYLQKGFYFGGIVFVVVSPWIIWNLITFHTIAQTSYQAKNMFTLHNQMPAVLTGNITQFHDVWELIKRASINLFSVAQYNAKHLMGEEYKPINKGNIVLYVFGGYMFLLLVLPSLASLFKKKERDSFLHHDSLNISLPVGLFISFHFFWYAIISCNYYNWYLLPPVLAFSIFHGHRFSTFENVKSKWPIVTAGILIFALILSTCKVSTIHVPSIYQKKADEKGFHDWQGKQLSILPEGSAIGLWNTGMVGYFSSFYFPQYRIINLDGVVNNEITRLKEVNEYETYVLSNIDYILDRPEINVPYVWMVRTVGKKRAQNFVKRHLKKHQKDNLIWIVRKHGSRSRSSRR